MKCNVRCHLLSFRFFSFQAPGTMSLRGRSSRSFVTRASVRSSRIRKTSRPPREKPARCRPRSTRLPAAVVSLYKSLISNVFSCFFNRAKIGIVSLFYKLFGCDGRGDMFGRTCWAFLGSSPRRFDRSESGLFGCVLEAMYRPRELD